MTLLKLVFRNIFRNTRRSLMTISAIAVGAMSLLLFGQFILRITLSMETVAVANSGHISIYKKGYFKYGAGNPTAYGIDGYQSILQLISNDSRIQPLIKILTPTVTLFGIAGNFGAETSKTFIGLGAIPADYNRMKRWDVYNLGIGIKHKDPELNETEPSHGIVGVGIARILGLCDSLGLADCINKKDSLGRATREKRDFSALQETTVPEVQSREPRLDLLTGTAGGAPNVVNFYVDRAILQGMKELDDAFVGMSLELAQQLLYGRGEKKAVALVLQLHQTGDMKAAKRYLEELIETNHLDLEVKDLLEVQPFFKQALGMLTAIFGFIAAIMVVIVLFTVVNTMSTSVMERTNEIGTLRALGVKKSGIVRQFVLEGALLGILGATAGLLLGSVVGVIVNHAGIMWLPPGQPAKMPLRVMNHGVISFYFSLAIWAGLGAISTLAAWFPARQAARKTVIDALGHV